MYASCTAYTQMRRQRHYHQATELCLLHQELLRQSSEIVQILTEIMEMLLPTSLLDEDHAKIVKEFINHSKSLQEYIKEARVELQKQERKLAESVEL